MKEKWKPYISFRHLKGKIFIWKRKQMPGLKQLPILLSNFESNNPMQISEKWVTHFPIQYLE